MILVIITIIIPIVLLKFDIELKLWIAPIFVISYILFRVLNNNAHKLYLQKEDREIELEIEKEKKKERENKKEIIKYGSYLIITGILLFIIGGIVR